MSELLLAKQAKDLLADIFREVFVLDDDVDVTTLNYRGIQAWDSVGHMQLVAGIETAFDVMFETEQVIGMSSFDKALEILAAHGIDINS